MEGSRPRLGTVAWPARYGLAGGLVVLVVCVVGSRRFEARAESSNPAKGTDSVERAGHDATSPGLAFPVPAVTTDAMSDSFTDPRGGRPHHAVDILAPRNADVVAVADGSVARLLDSEAGGTTLYQWSSDGRLCYYYAHLQSYAPGLSEGKKVRRGQLLGYVGTTGNAPPATPHLHFAIARVSRKGQWWGGEPVDPYPLLKRSRPSGD